MISKSKTAKPPKATTKSRTTRPHADAPNGSATAADKASGLSKTSAHPQDALLLLSQLEPSATNPRKHFDEAELDSLAESLKSVGMLEPILVREQMDYVKAGGLACYEIVAGERRYRAAKLARLKNVPCRIANLSDAEVLEIQLIENLERQDLNAIEEAIGFKNILAGGMTQAQLAAKIHRTQAHISNRVRLLELPDDWQQRVIEGKLPPTHARELLRFKDVAPVLKEIASDLKHQDELPTLSEFEDVVRRAAMHATESLSGHEYRGNDYIQWKIKPTPDEARELELIDVPSWAGKTEQRALNKKAFERLKKAAIEKVVARKSGKTAAAKPGGKQKPATATEERERSEKQMEQFARRLYDWRVDWLRRICDRKLSEIGTKQASGPLMMRLVLYFLTCNESEVIRDSQLISDRNEALEYLLRGSQLKVKERLLGSMYGVRSDLWAPLDEVPDDQLTTLTVKLVRSWLVNPDDTDGAIPTPHLPADRVEQLAKKLGVVLGTEWHAWRSEECVREYFELHTKAQLIELAKSVGDPWNEPSQPKSVIVEALVSQSFPCPDEILKAKEPKR